MKSGKRFPLVLYAAIALVLIWSGAGWIIYEVEKVIMLEENTFFNSRVEQFIALHGMSMVLIGVYIMVKNIVYKDSIVY